MGLALTLYVDQSGLADDFYGFGVLRPPVMPRAEWHSGANISYGSNSVGEAGPAGDAFHIVETFSMADKLAELALVRRRPSIHAAY